MTRRVLFSVCLVLGSAPVVGAFTPAQDSQPAREETEALPVRVISARPSGIVVIDRGESDGLQKRDKVVLHPLGQKSIPGRVVSTAERSAEVQLSDPTVLVAVGSRGIVHLPVKRFAPDEPVQGAEGAEEPDDEVPVAEPSPWENTDSEFEKGMPLLMQIDGVRPEDRVPLVSGRIFGIASLRTSSLDNRSDSFWRAGTDLHFENLFGQGGELVFVGEVNYRHTDVPGQFEESRSRLRVDRLSYAWGGTRFERERHEVGRFLQNGVPEFGVLDGYEWGHRLVGGNRFGTSIGYLPEPTPEMKTGQDFAVSGYYQWVADEREELTATAAFQKTWHNGAADRDLFVGRIDHWNSEGWDFHGTAWIDYYTSGDQAKGSGVELTRLVASSGRRFAGGDGIEFQLTHNRFPEIDRNEFLPVLAQQLANNHNERLSTNGWIWTQRDRRFFGELGAWVDQDDVGGDAELGVEQHNLFVEDSQTRASLFGVDGKFSTLYGMRLKYGIQATSSRWDVTYEYAQSDQVGFTSDNNTIEQHRLVASTDYQSSSGWSISLQGGATLWTGETAWAAGLYIQRSF